MVGLPSLLGPVDVDGKRRQMARRARRGGRVARRSPRSAPVPDCKHKPMRQASAPPYSTTNAERHARLAPLCQGLGLTEDELLDLGIDLLEELLSDDPEVLRARVDATKARASDEQRESGVPVGHKGRKKVILVARGAPRNYVVFMANSLPLRKRIAVFVRDRGTCVYCGATYQSGARLSVDHVVSRKRHGGDEYTNLVCACIACNKDKAHFGLKAYLVELQDRGRDTTGMEERVNAARLATIFWPAVEVALALYRDQTKTPIDDDSDDDSDD